ncbi:MAG: ATP-binding cassette domain-containing protein [Spirobacillus cienkowskii]|jgi:ATP-binding cassette subfamily C (CFTR/MRP) protein 1|uniref:ATP-binding cassette domain-containing protein n=1 Tax=Spirobacillus cienkowskii TaxID=495820 RepID=A0A369KPV2_9BACT|nr:MAG: ATP-binding cassette domain-containing protein [Spirobacillus cienkowskii]
MASFQKKYLFGFLPFISLISQKADLPEKCLQRAINTDRSLWFIFFSIFKKQIAICGLSQVLLILLLLFSPFLLKFFLVTYLFDKISIDQKRLIETSIYLVVFVTIYLLAFYLKKHVLLQWKTDIERYSIDFVARILRFSKKEDNNIIINNYIDKNGDFFVNKIAQIPVAFCLLFSFPALIAVFFCIYYFMNQLFLVPIIVLFLISIFKFRNQIFLKRNEKKEEFFLKSRSILLKKIFSFGRRVHLLAMENFFIKKINFIQTNSYNLAYSAVQKNSFSNTLFYFSGIIIAIPSITSYALFHKEAGLINLIVLILYFVIAAGFYSNIVHFYDIRKKFKSNFSFSFSKQSKKDLLQNDIDYEEDSLGSGFHQIEKQDKLWLHKASFVLGKEINLYHITYEHEPGHIVAIVGDSCSGKTSLLHAFAGELQLFGGERRVPQKFEIMPQELSFFSGTLRENIILGHEFEEKRYIEVIKATLLEYEINNLENGDDTFISINEQNNFNFLRKIAIARILYAKSEYYFFDDPLKGFSASESTQIFKEGFLKTLHGKNRVLVTQDLNLAALCNYVIVMKDGMIVEQGTHSWLIEKAGLYAKMHYAGVDLNSFNQQNLKNNTKRFSIKNSQIENLNDFNSNKFEAIKKENMLKYMFDSTIYYMRTYFSICKPYVPIALVVMSHISLSLSFLFLFSDFLGQKLTRNNQLIMFSLFSLLSVILFYYFSLKNIESHLKFGAKLEEKVYNLLIKEYQDEHHYTAKYLEKFSKFKEYLFTATTSFIVRISLIFSAIFLMLSTNITAFCFVVAMFSFTCVFFLVFKNSYFEKLDSLLLKKQNLKNITVSFFNSYINPNSQSFRSYLFNKINSKIAETDCVLKDKNAIIFYFYRFLCISIFLFSCLFLVYFVINSKNVNFGSVILSFISIIFLFQAFHHIGRDLNKFNQSIFYFKNLMKTSIRLQEFERNHELISEIWPNKGTFCIKSLNVQASKDNSFSIYNLDLFIPHASRFGLIAQKNQYGLSPFFSILFLFTKIESGSIMLDEEDILKINPLEFRNRYAYISMESLFPFLTLRENIDPEEKFDDSEIWFALNRVGVAQSVALLCNGLNTKIEDFPKHMIWTGEFILFSFAKTLLHKNKVIFLDNLTLTEEAEIRILELLNRELNDATILISAPVSSGLFKICHEVAKVDNEMLTHIPLIRSQQQPFSSDLTMH